MCLEGHQTIAVWRQTDAVLMRLELTVDTGFCVYGVRIIMS